MSQKISKKSRRRTNDELENTTNNTKNVVAENVEILESNSSPKEDKSKKADTSLTEEADNKHAMNTRSQTSTSAVKKVKNLSQAEKAEKNNDSKESNEDDSSSESEKLNFTLEVAEEVVLEFNESSENEVNLEPSILSSDGAELKNKEEPKAETLDTDTNNDEVKIPFVSLVRVPLDDIESEKDQLEKENSINKESNSVENNSENNLESSCNLEKILSNGHDDSRDSTVSYASASANENDSTTAVCGSNLTRMNADFSLKDSGIIDSPSDTFLNLTKDKSLVDTCRRLSSRRSIRPLNENFRKRALRNNLDYVDSPYPSRYSVERITGMKRKTDSITPPHTKRSKIEGESIFSYFSKPITTLKRRMSRSDLRSSSPTLTSFKSNQEEFDLLDHRDAIGSSGNEDLDKKWCSIM